MAPVLGILATLKVGGASTPLTNEPTSKVTANTVYHVTNTAKRVIDPETPLVVEVDADGGGAGGYVVADPSTYTVDWLRGKVTFDADQGASAVVRVSGAYIPLLAIAEVREMDVEVTTVMKDGTTCDDAATMALKFLAGLLSAQGSASGLSALLDDHDPDLGELTVYDVLTGREPKFLEYRPAPTGQDFRGWVLLENASQSTTKGELVTSSFRWRATEITPNNQTEAASFSWGQ